MNLFQWITLPILGLLLLRDGLGLVLGRPSFRRDRLVRWLVWGAAFATIANPNLMVVVATTIGIGRGTDLVLYLFVLAFLGSAFYFYSQNVRLHRQLTDVVRHMAIQEARKESAPSPAASPEPARS